VIFLVVLVVCPDEVKLVGQSGSQRQKIRFTAWG